MNKPTQHILLFLGAACLVLSIILSSYHLLLYEKARFADTAQRNVIDYVRELDELTIEMSPAEQSHLYDVQLIMRATRATNLLTILGLLTITTILYKEKEILLEAYYYGSLGTISIILALGIFGAFAFNILFTLFHWIFFPQGNWTFPTESVLITLFPAKYFITFFVELILTASFLASIFIGASVYLNKKWQHHSSSSTSKPTHNTADRKD